MSSIGSQLKEAREKKSVSLDDVHAKIKIHPRVLQLLEEDKFDRLPSPLFVKSFLKSYAEFLEIDPENLVDTYEKNSRKDPEQILYIKSAAEKVSLAGGRPRPWILPAAILAVILGGGYLLFHLKPPKTSPKPKKPAIVKKVPKAAPAAAVKEAAQSRSPEWARSVEQGNFPKLDAKAPMSLQIKALNVVWVRVKADGKVLFQGILKQGAAETWPARETLELWTGNAANMYLTLNGNPLGSPGKGMVKRMVISREGVRIPSAESR